MTARATHDIAYSGYEQNIRLANDEVELLLPTRFGPRVLRYAPLGGKNVFGEISPAEQGNETPFGDQWHLYGGHRLWYAPEGNPRSYFPDNQAVRAEIEGARVRLTQPIEAHSRLEKCIEVTLASSSSHVSVVHRLTNHGAFDVELAPWALSVMAKGGFGIFPQAPYVPHPRALAPARPLVLWHFTRLHDPRWTFGDRLFFLRHDPSCREAQKIGFYNEQGWMAYAAGDALFIKRHAPLPGVHADFGCNAETFTNDAILELETLGPLARITPGQSAVHVEDWWLFPKQSLAASEAEVLRALDALLPLAKPSDSA